MILQIKITGSGTNNEIATSLRAVINDLIDYDGNFPANWEDKTLFIQLNKKNEQP